MACQRKVRFIKEINPQVVFGNGWIEHGVKAYPPQYSLCFAMVVSQAKIAVDVHETEWGTNRKMYELMQCTFTLVDLVEGVEDILGYKLAEKVCFANPRECRELIEYYLREEAERERMWKWERRVTAPYTYENNLKKIVDMVERYA